MLNVLLTRGNITAKYIGRSDIFDFKCDPYLMTVDHFTKYIEVDNLLDINCVSTIDVSTVLNGPQFSYVKFANIREHYSINPVSSSLINRQSNGDAETKHSTHFI